MAGEAGHIWHDLHEVPSVVWWGGAVALVALWLLHRASGASSVSTPPAAPAPSAAAGTLSDSQLADLSSQIQALQQQEAANAIAQQTTAPLDYSAIYASMGLPAGAEHQPNPAWNIYGVAVSPQQDQAKEGPTLPQGGAQLVAQRPLGSASVQTAAPAAGVVKEGKS